MSSISKQFIAASALLLAEAGALSLLDPVTKWWHPAPSGWREIRIANLLTHTAGLPHWAELGLDMCVAPPSRHDLLDRLLREPLLSTPGAEWRYSGPGYVLAAVVLSEAAGQPYEEFVTEQIFRPLGMTATSSGEIPGSDLIAHAYRDGQAPVPLVRALNELPGTGDVWSTVEDLGRYLDARFDSALLSRRMWETMSEACIPIDDPTPPGTGTIVTQGYGYALYTGTLDGREIQYHPGDNPGYRSLIAWLPETRSSVCVLSNDESISLDLVLPRVLSAAGDMSARSDHAP